jgi:soluble lytic murein transglycosylase
VAMSSFGKLPAFFVSSIVALSTAQAARGPNSAENRPDPDKVQKAQELAEAGKPEEAAKILSAVINKETEKERRALARMALAVIDFQASRDAEAEEQFRLALEDGTRIPDYAHYHLGILKRKSGRDQEAQAEFLKVIELKPAKRLEVESRYQIADLLVASKQWKPAISHLESLRKAYRGQDKYAEILFNLVRADLQLGRKAAACKPARELYAKYPSLPLLRDWGPQLATNAVDGIKIGCSADNKDLKTRVRRLWLGGEADRATAELRSFKVEGTVEGEDGEVEPAAYGIDAMLANHLLGEGHVDEAMKLILKHYGTQKNRPNYLSLLAKASSRAGEYQASIAAYQKAYDVAPRAKNSANNLFQAAFTSYQIQDYDGATRRFEKLVKAFPNSRLTTDARWHLAWMRYLRTDYQGAFESFASLSRAPKFKRTRRGRRIVVGTTEIVANDRIQYWSAMSLLRQGKTKEAIPLFEKLVRDPAVGYYSLASYYRLTGIPNAKVPAGVEARFGLARRTEGGAAPTEEELRAAAADAMATASEEIVADNPSAEGSDAVGADTTAAAADADETDGSDSVADAGEMAGTEVSQFNFKDAGLAIKFERARDLAFVGLEEGARRELGEIERRARSVADRKLLMTEYSLVRNYERSSYIGELGFGSARLRDGLRGESKQYWEYAYPRAWEASVVKASRATSVPEQLIWGIMRAESHYRPDVQSPVGALGLMQIMPFTGRKVASLLNIGGFETRSLLEPETNIRLGARYLQRLLEKFKGSVPLTAASYNAGPHRVHAWVRNFGSLDMDEFIEHIPFVETRNYVKRVTRNFQIYGFLYNGSDRATAKSLRWLVQPVGVELKDSVTAAEIW